MSNYLFTSESVSEGHPDKVADQISDAVLDAHLSQDPNARVTCETLITKNTVHLAGEITSKANVNYRDIVVSVLKKIGYTRASGFDIRGFSLTTSFSGHSNKIARRLKQKIYRMGAGDKGMIFGYACNETDALMPAPIFYAHKIIRLLTDLRKNNKLPWLRPDAKCQVSFLYENNKPVSVEQVYLSTQHSPKISLPEIRSILRDEVVIPVVGDFIFTIAIPEFVINPTGRFIKGGPAAGTGLTGRKIIVDTYGGSCPHGGGAFSGKDAAKVVRSGAYYARYVAKNIVAAGLAERCTIQVSYAIGLAEPISLYLNTHGTGKYSNDELLKAVNSIFDFRPKAIIDSLNLRRPIYQNTAAYGHFGREEDSFTWEKTDKINDLTSFLSKEV